MNQALLIIDVQKDFLPGGTLAIDKADEIVPVINALIHHFKTVLAVKDWHPRDHNSFASTHNKLPYTTMILDEISQELWPDHCIQDTEGSDFPSLLDTSSIKHIFYKGSDPLIDSYSAFFDKVRHRSTGLADYLKEQDIDTLYITGIATDYCVKYSALDALELGFSVHVIQDACHGIDLNSGDIEHALLEMKAAGVQVIRSASLLG